MQKHVNLVDLVKSFPTNIYLQTLASIQKRTSPLEFAHLAEKSENGSIKNPSTKEMLDAGADPNSAAAGSSLLTLAVHRGSSDFDYLRFMGLLLQG